MCTLCLTVPALAQSISPSGDGSQTDNDRLVPGRYPTDPVLASAGGLREPYDPFFDIDWSLALRGSYTKGSSGERFDVRLVPSVTLEHTGTRSSVTAMGSAEIVRPSQGQIDVSALRLSGTVGYALDSDTTLTAGGRFSLTRAIAGTPGLASDITIAPQTITGGGDLGVTRQLGKFNIGLTGSADRSTYGKTTLSSGAVVDNAEQNNWALESGLRVGFQITPIFEVFGKASVGRDVFDLPSTTLGFKPDAATTTLEGGVTGRWNSILEATASTGVSLRRFDAAGLDEVTTQLYDAQLSFTPDPTLRMTAGFTTTVAPPGPNGSGSTRIGYGAHAEIAYTANSRLALRALANWSGARFVGSNETETGYGLGAGADYKVNAHTAVTADYNFDSSDSSSNGLQDAHQVTVGVKLSR
ncbi:MAG: DUF5777 family beta-barrel protein [Devosia sp.]